MLGIIKSYSDVARELADGLGDGSVVLDTRRQVPHHSRLSITLIFIALMMLDIAASSYLWHSPYFLPSFLLGMALGVPHAMMLIRLLYGDPSRDSTVAH
jgi:hypothetical protein